MVPRAFCGVQVGLVFCPTLLNDLLYVFLNNFGIIKFQNELLYKIAAGDMSLRQAKSLLKVAVKSGVKVAEQKMVDQNTKTFGSIFSTLVTPFSQKKTMENFCLF